MYQVLGLRKTADTEPEQLYELRLRDKENRKPGYMFTTEYGTEEQVRDMLRSGGMTKAHIDLYFALASRHA